MEILSFAGVIGPILAFAGSLVIIFLISGGIGCCDFKNFYPLICTTVLAIMVSWVICINMTCYKVKLTTYTPEEVGKFFTVEPIVEENGTYIISYK